MSHLERLALRRSHQAQQRAPEVGLVTALVRHAPRKSEIGRDDFTTLRIVDGRATLLEQRGAANRALLEARLRWIAFGAALIASVVCCILDRGGAQGCSFGSDPDARTRILMNQMANEAMPQFLADHPGRACPVLDELLVYMNSKSGWDAWGTPLYLHCLSGTTPTMHVVSAGPDRQFWTDDDIDSRGDAP